MVGIMTQDSNMPQRLGKRLEEATDKLMEEFVKILEVGYQEDNNFYSYLTDIRCIARKLKNES